MTDISYSNGFLRGRFTAVDESDGTSRTGPGVHGRVRCRDVVAYHADEPGVVAVYAVGFEDPFYFCGTVEGCDEAMARSDMTTVTGGKKADVQLASAMQDT